jgi:integrase
VLALTTGMRQGELLGLGRADVDLPAGLVAVRSSLQVDASGGGS